MKKIAWTIYLVLLTTLVGALGYLAVRDYLSPSPTHRTSSGVSLGVVSQEQIFSRALVFQSLNNETEASHKKFHAEVIKVESELRVKEEQLKKLEESTDTPSEELHKTRQEFQKQLAQLEQLAQRRKQELQDEYNLHLEIIKRNLEDAVEKVAREKGLLLIVDSKSVMFNNGLDVTDDIIADLNQRIATVKFKLN